MKKFVKNVLLFFICITIISSTIASILYSNRDRLIDYRLNDDAKTIFIGNSMLEFAIVDSRLPQCQNVAKSAKQYLFALADLREILDNNPQVKTVVLGCSPFTLRENNADQEYYDAAYIESVNFYAPFLNIKEYAMLPQTLPFLKFYMGVYGLRFLRDTQKPGGYLYNTRNRLAKDIALREQGGTDGKSVASDRNESSGVGNSITIYCLEQIKQLCADHNVKLKFVSTPIWHARESYDLDVYRALMRKYLTENESDIYDYTELELPDSCYADVIHLNHWGADRFTEVLAEGLNH